MVSTKGISVSNNNNNNNNKDILLTVILFLARTAAVLKTEITNVA